MPSLSKTIYAYYDEKTIRVYQAYRLDAARELLLQERVYTVRLDGEMDIFQGVS